jgi:3-oxoacyl-[acyl-carrier protein] reductase
VVRVGTFDGKVAVITGGGHGFGEATARRFVADGAAVVLADIDEDAARAVADSLGDAAVAVATDVRRSADVAAMVALAESAFGGLDVLVNNAGLSHPSGPIEDMAEEDYDRCVDVGLKGVWLGCRHGVPALRRRGGGVILNTSSVSALTPRAQASVYCATKAAVVTLTKSLALELAPDIRVNCVCPVLSPTRFVLSVMGLGEDRLEEVQATARAAFTADVPLGRLCEPEDVAAAFAYLASDEAAFITGVALPVDGGRSAGQGSGAPAAQAEATR